MRTWPSIARVAWSSFRHLLEVGRPESASRVDFIGHQGCLRRSPAYRREVRTDFGRTVLMRLTTLSPPPEAPHWPSPVLPPGAYSQEPARLAVILSSHVHVTVSCVLPAALRVHTPLLSTKPKMSSRLPTTRNAIESADERPSGRRLQDQCSCTREPMLAGSPASDYGLKVGTKPRVSPCCYRRVTSPWSLPPFRAFLRTSSPTPQAPGASSRPSEMLRV